MPSIFVWPTATSRFLEEVITTTTPMLNSFSISPSELVSMLFGQDGVTPLRIHGYLRVLVPANTRLCSLVLLEVLCEVWVTRSRVQSWRKVRKFLPCRGLAQELWILFCRNPA